MIIVCFHSNQGGQWECFQLQDDGEPKPKCLKPQRLLAHVLEEQSWDGLQSQRDQDDRLNYLSTLPFTALVTPQGCSPHCGKKAVLGKQGSMLPLLGPGRESENVKTETETDTFCSSLLIEGTFQMTWANLSKFIGQN